MSDYQPTPPPSAPYTSGWDGTPQRSPVLSILALIFGIVGVLTSLFLFGFGILPGIAGVVLGFVGRSKEPAAKGLWLTGIITGFVAIAIALAIFIGLGALFAFAVHQQQVTGS